jgi:hypothetical protein
MNENTSLAQMNMTIDPARSYKSTFSIDLLCAGRDWKTGTNDNNDTILLLVRSPTVSDKV